MDELDKERTAFSTPQGHTNAPTTFQRLMECVLSGLTYEQCFIYLDDIIIFSASFNEHLHRLANVAYGKHISN